MDEHDEEEGLLDAEHFLRVSDGLKEAFRQLQDADLDAAAKERWQRRLIAITTVAKRDLARAEAQLTRFQQDFRMQGDR